MSCTSASYDVISQTSWLCRNRHAMMRGVYINRKGAFCFNSRLHMHMTDLKSRSKLLQLVYLRRWWLKWFVEFRNKSIISVQTFPKQYFVLFEIYQATGPQWKQNSWVCWWRWNLTTCLNSAFQSGKCCFQYQKVSGFSQRLGGSKKTPHPSPFTLLTAGRGDPTHRAELAGSSGQCFSEIIAAGTTSRDATEILHGPQNGPTARRGGADLGVECPRWIMAIWSFPRGFASHLNRRENEIQYITWKWRLGVWMGFFLGGAGVCF